MGPSSLMRISICRTQERAYSRWQTLDLEPMGRRYGLAWRGVAWLGLMISAIFDTYLQLSYLFYIFLVHLYHTALFLSVLVCFNLTTNKIGSCLLKA